jgi:diguanylate cyclase (GGDEF)-like protein
MMKVKSSLRSKLIFALFLGCLIPYILGGFYLNTYIKNWLYHNSIDNAKQVLHQVNELIEQSLLSDIKEEVTFLASLDDVKNASKNLNDYTTFGSQTFTYEENNIENNIGTIFKALKDSHNKTNFIFLGTEDGGYMEYPQFLPTDNYDPRQRPWYQETIGQEQIVMSEPYITNVTKDMVVSFTKSIKNTSTDIGVIGVSVRLDDLTDSINKIKIGDTGYIVVMSPKQKFIVSPNHPEWVLKTPDELGLDAFKKLEDIGASSYEYQLNGITRIFNVETTKDNGLRIISVIKKDEILHKASEITNILIIIYLITFVIIFIIVYLISKRITEPILIISSVINRMTDFDFNFKAAPNMENYVKQRDEIGIVTTALLELHHNYVELIGQIKLISTEIKNIDIEKNNQLKLELSEKNPFYSVIISMNVVLEKIYLSLNELKATNIELSNKNDLLTVSEEELIAQLEEIDSQKDYINFLALHDTLTGLPNRRRFIDLLTYKIEIGLSGAVVLLDLDDFKGINDTRGHVFGDRVLEAISVRLKNLVTDKIEIFRFGGDEFLILIECNKDFNELVNHVKTISHIFDEKIQIDDSEIEIRISMGISLFPDDSNDVNQLVMNADLAMYTVKNSGKNGYQFFDSSMVDTQNKKAYIEHLLREAIHNDGFKLVYQPQIDVMTGQIHSYEALLRLKSSQLSPMEFIPVAEANGSIIKIGRIVTEKVIEQLSRWKAQGLDIKPVAINFSANQLHDGSYIMFLSELLKKYKINADRIEIEITENIFLENKQYTLNFLQQLKAMGIKIAIDDFGTGYSSLNYLTFVPVDIIKLDRSLSMKFLEHDNNSVMGNLISLIHSLGLTVVAEGIETNLQVNKLKETGCDYIQGFYYSKPVEENEIPLLHTTIFYN